MTIRIGTTKFSGGSGLNNGVLADALRGLAQVQAKASAATVAALTDNSAGAAADGTVGLIPLCTATPLTGDTCPTKAEVEAAFVTVNDALTEIAAKVIAINAKVPVFVSRTNSIGGVAADGTIAAVTKTITGATSARVAMAGFNTAAAAIRNVVTSLTRDVNQLALACGLTTLVNQAGGDASGRAVYSDVYPLLAPGTGTAAANGLTSVTSAEATATLVAMAAAVKELATKLNAVVAAGTPVPTVIAL